PRARLAEERVAVRSRHGDVAEQHVGWLVLQGLDCLRGRLHGAHARPGLLEHRRDGLAGARVVIHQEPPYAPRAGARVELAVGAREPQEDAAAPGGELDGVREEVPHDLLEASRIALDRLRSELEDALHPDLLRLGVGTYRVERRLGDGREIDRPGIEDELPG